MNRRFAAGLLATLVLLAGGIALGTVVDSDALNERQRVSPALTQFSVSNASCVADATNETRVNRATHEESSYLTLERNLTVPGRGASLNATFARVGLANYTLRLRTVAADGAARPCSTGAARVTVVATVQVPHSAEEPYRITVRHENETLAVVRNDPSGLTVD